MAASRAIAILQRGRSHGGQVIVVTQSVGDPEALSGQPGLLPSLTDNFSGVVAHRQTAPIPGLAREAHRNPSPLAIDKPDHRPRLERLRPRLSPPRSRVQNRILHFAQLSQGEAMIYTTLGPNPRRATILPSQFDDRPPDRIGTAGRHTCELSVHPEERLPPAASSAPEEEAPMGPDPHSTILA